MLWHQNQRSCLCPWRCILARVCPPPRCVQAVRIGDLELFHSVATRYTNTLRKDKTSNLIVRLRHNVIRTALRRISLADSLHLPR